MGRPSKPASRGRQFGLCRHWGRSGSTSAISRIADGHGTTQRNGSFLHQRTHTSDPQLPVALSGVQRRLTECSGQPHTLFGGSGSASAGIEPRSSGVCSCFNRGRSGSRFRPTTTMAVIGKPEVMHTCVARSGQIVFASLSSSVKLGQNESNKKAPHRGFSSSTEGLASIGRRHTGGLGTTNFFSVILFSVEPPCSLVSSKRQHQYGLDQP